MTTKSRSDARSTTMVPVTTMEELPVLSNQERGDLQQSLIEAEDRIRSGEFVAYDQHTFMDRLHRTRDEAKHRKA